VPLRAELRETVATLSLRLMSHRRRETERRRRRIAELAARLRVPKRRLTDIRIALDDLNERMRIALARLREVRRGELVNLSLRLEHQNPRSRIAGGRRELAALGRALGTAWEKQTAGRANRVRSKAALLDSLSPLAVLRRGYSITRRLTDGLILRRAESAAAGQEVSILLSEGSLHATITGTFEEHSDGQGKI
jgi:exodeoxyribonuclease VII large subunit